MCHVKLATLLFVLQNSSPILIHSILIWNAITILEQVLDKEGAFKQTFEPLVIFCS